MCRPLFLLLFAGFLPGLAAQNAPPTSASASRIISPEIAADRTVTFRIRAPGARSVRLTSGGDASFARLLDWHYDVIYRFAWKWCGHQANAEDIAQLACIKLANSLNQFRFQAAFTSWLYQLVLSVAQDWQRSQRRHDHDELDEDTPVPNPTRAEDQIYLAEVIEQLDALGQGMKETALLVHAEGLSHAEAGAMLGVSESTIAWRIHTIRKHMNKPEAAMSGGL